MRVPLPYADRLAVTGPFTENEIHQSVESAREREIPISILSATQHRVGSGMVERYSRGEGKTSGPPLVIAAGGLLAIRNGHHRTVNAIQQGQRTIRAKVASLGPRPLMKFRSDQLLLMSPEATAVEYREHDVQDVATMVGDIAVIEIETPLESKPGSSWWGYFDDYESILCRFQNALDADECRSVLLKIDSPGGSAAGLNECVDAMIRAKNKSGKRVVAYADEGAYSAAYAIACAADEIYLPRAGGLGSIGVISQLHDQTRALAKAGIRVEVITSGKNKALGNPNVPLSKRAIRHVQGRVDGLAKIYWKLVASARHMSVDDVRALEAGVFYGKRAHKKGLADGVETLENVIAKMTLDNLGGSGSPSSKKRNSRQSDAKGKRMSVKALALALEAAQKTGDAKKIATAQAALIQASKKIVTTEEKSSSSSGSSSSMSSMSMSHSSGSSSSSSSSSSGSSSSSSGSSGSSSSSSSEESEEEEKKEEEKALVAFVLKETGAKDARSAIGALAALKTNAKGAPENSKRLARLESERAKSKVEAIISDGKAAAKITPGNEKGVREFAKEHGYRALRTMVANMLPSAAATDFEPAEELGEGISLTAEERKTAEKMGFTTPERLKKFATNLARAKSKKAGH